MSTVIKIENLSKKYVIGHQKQKKYTALRDVLAQKMQGIGQRLLHPLSPNKEETKLEDFWALKDINLVIKQGDRVGIIGRNGAGKSTLLKILSRITEPTTGRITIDGRVASLLEVGTGFHPELTGRENIFLNGAILGMSRVEIKRKFDEIVDFAEVEKFLDTPVKRYSSGMYVRLAFAVAAHLEPEILVVDEVLAVGDTQFQKKCLGKLQDAGKEGRTVLFVSHNMAAIKTLCSTGVVLDRGRELFTGEVVEAVGRYLGSHKRHQEVCWSESDKAPENEYIRLESITAKSRNGSIIDLESGIKISTVFLNKTEGKRLSCVLHVFTLDGVCLFVTGIYMSSSGSAERGSFSTKCVIPPHLLNAGEYKVDLLIIESQRDLLFKVENVISFEVEHAAASGGRMNRAPGVIRPLLDWKYEFTHW